MALEFAGAMESSHMQHPDFRVGGKIFATLGYPNAEWAMLKLTPDEQELFVQLDPKSFEPVPGGWGQKGATRISLPSAKKSVVRDALQAAWRLRAPAKLVARVPSGRSTGRARS
ncbi:MAG TPA: MmcQ/YjbR family DNA-binding protein [Thermoanaerobaculia bacterium]